MKRKVYKQWSVEGIRTTFPSGILPRQEYKKFCVRYTSDKYGMSLSIADEETGTMFHIPLEPLKEIIKERNEPN